MKTKWGRAGELHAGWDLLITIHGKDIDGGMPRDAEKISGSTNTATFWNYDHYELREPLFADEALAYLPSRLNISLTFLFF